MDHVFVWPRFNVAVIVPDVVIGVEPIVSVEAASENPTEVTDPLPLLLKVDQSVPERHPVTPAEAVVQPKAPEDPLKNCPRVPEYVIGAVTVGVEVETVFTFPLLPIYSPPCESDVKNKLLDNVEDAVEKNPFKKPSVVVVEFPHEFIVKGKANVLPELIPSDDVAMSEYVPMEFPTRTCPYVGTVDVPVPPWKG